jgi:ABC-type transport system involved in multi-copper enzyme maturation permease subunit
MNFLPIVAREARVTVRKPMTYYSRSLAALLAAALGLGLTVAGFMGAISTASAGAGVFQGLAITAYLFAAVQATLLTCDCLSQEKREGTLGLLFLTDLRGYDIVIGKLASQVSRPLYCLIAALPALGFALLLGGVALGNFAQTAAALLNTLFFFGALGLLISACNVESRQAIARSAVGLAIFGAALPAAGLWARSAPLAAAFLAMSPGGAFLIALGPPYSAAAHGVFGWSLLVSHLMGWACLAAASWLLPRSLRDQAGSTRARASGSGSESIIKRRPLPRRFDRRREPCALLGMTLQHGESWRPIEVLLVATAMVFLGANALTSPGRNQLPVMAALVLVLHLILKVLTVSQACRALVGRRQSGELELILTTPFDEDDILSGCLIALKRQLLWPVLYVLAVDLVVLAEGWRELGLVAGMGWAAALALEVLWMLVNLYCLTWVGLLLGMTSRNQAMAIGRTFFYVVILPWPALLLSVAIVGGLTIPMGFQQWAAVVPAPLLFLLLWVACNFGFLGWAISELKDRFRLLAATES